MLYDCYAATDRGGGQLNQDRVLLHDRYLDAGQTRLRLDAGGLLLAAVSDGVTHCTDGALAAEWAVEKLLQARETIAEELSRAGEVSDPLAEQQTLRALKQPLLTISRQLVEQKTLAEAHSFYAATLSVALLFGGRLRTLCVGDSPLLLLRQGEFYSLNRNSLIFTDEEQQDFVYSLGRLSDYIGLPNIGEDHIYAVSLALQAGDRLLLCSDGITDALCAERLRQILERGGPGRKARNVAAELVQQSLALTGEDSDNLSAIVIFVRNKGK